MNQIIEKIHYNWRQEQLDGDAGENYDLHVVGMKGVESITEHCAIGEGDRWFYDVKFEDGRMERIFNPNHIFYKPE